MRKTLVAGFVLVGLFSGCMSEMDPALKRQYDLDAYRWQCENNAGIKDNTPEMEVCIQQKDEGRFVQKMSQSDSEKTVYVEPDSPRGTTPRRVTNNQMSPDAMIRMGGAMYSCAIYGTTPNPVTGVCLPPPPRQSGTVYDNSGRLIGTYVED